MAKTKRMVVRCDSFDELEGWHRKARKLGYRSTSAYVRDVMNKAMSRPDRKLPLEWKPGDFQELLVGLRDRGRILNSHMRQIHARQVHRVDESLVSLVESVDRVNAEIVDLALLNREALEKAEVKA